MATYISLLRGINVGGQKKIKTEELLALFDSLGLKNVRTYVQSGNVIFNSPQRDIQELAKLIETKIVQAFNFSVAVLVRTPDELQRIIDDNPFLREKTADTGKLHVTFLSAMPAKSVVEQMKEMHNESDKFIISNKEIYLYCPDGYGRTKYSNDFFEKKLGMVATTRNWKTVNMLLDMAKKNSLLRD